jgi:PAS domain S-box-containing protein
MEEKFIILCCENIRPEVDAILATGEMPDAVAESFTFHCGHVRSFWGTLRNTYDAMEAAGAHVCLCGCGCSNSLDIPGDVLARPTLTLVGAGESLFLPKTLVEHYQRDGEYLELPGRLLRWKQNAECNHLSQSMAQEMFKESATGILLLDTGVHAGVALALAEFSKFTGLPARTLPVGLENLRQRLATEYRNWQARREIAVCKAAVRLSERRVADYSMVADLTGIIIGIHDETEVIRKVLEFIVLISSPERVGFLMVDSSGPGEIISIPPGAYSSASHFLQDFDPEKKYRITGSDGSYLFSVTDNQGQIGVLAVDAVSIPAALDEYINITHFISQIAGLSITIARTHANLLLAMKAREMEIADRIRVELALRESEERYRTIIENIQDVFFRIDGENRVVMASPSAAPMFGYDSVEELLGKPVHSLWKNPQRREAFLENMKTGGGAVQDWEAEFVKKDGSEFWVSLSFHLHQDLHGRYAGTEGIIRDISERKKIEEALKGAIKKLNMLSSITRHDILNQITGLRTYLDLSREDLKGTRFAEFIEKEDQAAEAIQHQIEFTKYYQDIGVNAPKWQDAGTIIKDASEQLNPPGIRVQITVDNIEIFADPLIVKVFFNLMENSLRHGERVTEITFGSYETGSGLVIIYHDNGVGIAEEDKKKLFRKGFGKHTGLGLFLSREILSITGITICETGEPGRGVQFEITVPPGGFRFTSENG